MNLNKLLLMSACLCMLSDPSAAAPLEDGMNAYMVGNYAKAGKFFAPLAEQGNAEAQFRLGTMYADGQGVRRDDRLAVKWLNLAANQGHASAQQKLGIMYRDGRGVQQDYQEALKWFRLSAEQGNAFAQRNLSAMYGEGHGVPQNYVLALMWENISSSNAAASDSANQTELVEQNNSVAMYMDPRQVEKAQRLTIKCASNNFKGC